MFPLGTLSLGLWVIAVDPAFIAGHQSIKNCGIWIDQLDHLPAVMTTSFFLIFSEHRWDKLRANLPHLQFLADNCVYSFHTDIKLCTYYLYRHTTTHPWISLFGQSTLVFWLPYSSLTSHNPSQTPCLPWISYPLIYIYIYIYIYAFLGTIIYQFSRCSIDSHPLIIRIPWTWLIDF